MCPVQKHKHTGDQLLSRYTNLNKMNDRRNSYPTKCYNKALINISGFPHTKYPYGYFIHKYISYTIQGSW